MGRIPEDTIQQIRHRVDIVDLVGRFVSLKRSGRSHKGLCPFHEEKTPSFNVNSDREAFYCFGCQASGNAISFLMKMENLTFPEAVRVLGRDVGVEIPETAGGLERGLSERLYAANELAQKRYHAALAAPGNPGAAYLERRGLDRDTIERFGLGFAPNRWDFIAGALAEEKIPAELGEKAGLLAPRDSGGHYDRLRGRVVFPIRDVPDRVVGFGGRAIRSDQEPKYLNTPESPIYRKREGFFGFPAALEPIRRTERAVIVEGYFDLIALHRAGVEGALATCGTALTTDHARNLRRRTRQVVMLFDGDEAGQQAVERALEVLVPEGLRVRAALLPGGEDPDSFLAREGAEALRELVAGAPPAIEIVIRRAVSKGCRTPWEKADAVGAVAPHLARVRSEVERSEFARQLGLAVGTAHENVEAAVRAVSRGEDARDAMPIAPRLADGEERKLKQLVRSLVEHPHLAERVPRDELTALVPARALAELLEALVAAAAEDRRVDLEELGARLSDEARNLLFSVCADEHELEESAAVRTVDDTVDWLYDRRFEAQQRDLTRRMREDGADIDALMLQKKELNERSRQRKERARPETRPPNALTH